MRTILCVLMGILIYSSQTYAETEPVREFLQLSHRLMSGAEYEILQENFRKLNCLHRHIRSFEKGEIPNGVTGDLRIEWLPGIIEEIHSMEQYWRSFGPQFRRNKNWKIIRNKIDELLPRIQKIEQLEKERQAVVRYEEILAARISKANRMGNFRGAMIAPNGPAEIRAAARRLVEG